MFRKYLLTALVHVVEHDKAFQIYFGAVVCVLSAILMCGKNTPYADKLHGKISSAALVQLALTYVSALLFYDDGDQRSLWWQEEERKWGIILVVGNSLVFLWMAWRLGCAVTDSLDDAKGAIHIRETGYLMALPPRAPGIAWHIFVSHTWATAQDQARVIKERLKQLVPGINTFLDVDNLDDISRLEDYVAASQVILIFLSGGYVTSRNCLRELRAAVHQKKTLLVVRETEDQKGRISDESVRESLKDEPELLAALFDAPSVDWQRVSEYQNVSLLQIARQLVPEAKRNQLYLPGGPLEEMETCVLPPAPSVHLYVSPHNVGADLMAQELGQAFVESGQARGRRSNKRARNRNRVALEVTSESGGLSSAGAMLLLLDKSTWSAPADDMAALTRKRSLAQDVSRAMREGIKIIMAHECA